MLVRGTYFIILTTSLWAQEFSFRGFTPADGLSHNTVYASYQDEQGFLWFGTYESVDRFDGRTFTNPLAATAIPVNRVRAICADRLGGFWLATHGGAIRMGDGSPALFDRAAGLADDSTFRVFRDSQARLWIATAAGLNRLEDDGHYRLFTTEQGLPHNIVRNMIEDGDGLIWAGTQQGLALFDGYGFQPVSLPIEADAGIYGMVFDKRNRLWIGTDDGLFCFDRGTWQQLDENNGLPSREVWALCLDRFGVLWVGTDSGATFLDLDLADAAHPVFASPGHHEVARTTIYSIEEDNEGNLWFGTCIGLYQLRERALRNLDLSHQGAGAMVLSIAEDTEGRLWFGTDQGVVVREQEGLRILTGSLDLPDHFIRCLTAPKQGGIWLGTRRGALFLQGTTRLLLNRESGLKDDHILTLYSAQDGSLYLGSLRGGLAVRRDGHLQSYDEGDGLSANRVYSLCDDGDGGVWIGTESGINRLTPAGLSRLTLRLPGKEVAALHRDRHQRLWIGTSGGLATLDDGELRFWPADRGGPDSACRFIAEDAAGAIWIGATRGVWRWWDEHFQRFDGAPWTPREMNFGAWTKDNSDRLWFGHFNGVLQVDPTRIMAHTPPPPIMLTGLAIYDRPLALAPGLALDYNNNQPSFQYTGLSYRAPDQLDYQYRLEGYDHDWQTTAAGEAIYPGLAPGRYCFFVRARDRDGTTSSEPVSFPFRIKPPFWQTLWFRLMLLAAVILLILSQIQHLRLRNRLLANEATYLAAQVEKAQVAKLQQEAELKLLYSQMNPHFLQNAFTSAIYFVKSSPQKAEQILTKLAALFTQSMQSKRQVWSTLEAERSICSDYLEIQKLRFGERLSYQIRCPQEQDEWPLPGFVLQPLVENAVLHGMREMVDRLQIDVTFEVIGVDRLRVTVANTGQPLDQPIATLARAGHALHNIDQRLALLGLQPLTYAFDDGRHIFTFSTEGPHAHHTGG